MSACIEDQAVIDKILAQLIKKGALSPRLELLPATRASPDTGWFALRWVFTLLYTAQQQKERLPGGLLRLFFLYLLQRIVLNPSLQTSAR